MEPPREVLRWRGTAGSPEPSLTVKLLLMFLVLVSATLASDRSTSSKIRDCGEKTEPQATRQGCQAPPQAFRLEHPPA